MAGDELDEQKRRWRYRTVGQSPRRWPYYRDIDWSAYHARLDYLLNLKLKGHSTGTLQLLHAGVPGVYVAYNWFPFYAEDRRDITKFRTTQEIEIDPFPIMVDPDTGESHMLFVGPTVPAGVDATLTVRVPVIDLNKWDIGRVTQTFRRLLHEVLQNRPTPKEAPAMTRSVPPTRAFLQQPSAPEGEHAMVRFRVAVSEMTTRDIQRTVKAFKTALTEVIEARPIGDEASGLLRTVPFPFLLHARDDAFLGDVRRYLLYHIHGLSIRQVAYLEEQQKRGRPVENMPRKIGRKVQNESGVWESIARIYEAVHRKPLSARRRRLDTPAEGNPPYQCDKPNHQGGAACPPQCSNFQAWWGRVSPSLPIETTGKLHGEMRVDLNRLKSKK